MGGRPEKRNINTETKMEFLFSSIGGVTNTHEERGDILFARRSSLGDEQTFKRNQLKNLVLSMPSDCEINREGTKYKRSKYLWDDIPLLIQTAYRKHEVAADRSGKVSLSVYAKNILSRDRFHIFFPFDKRLFTGI